MLDPGNTSNRFRKFCAGSSTVSLYRYGLPDALYRSELRIRLPVCVALERVWLWVCIGIADMRPICATLNFTSSRRVHCSCWFMLEL